MEAILDLCEICGFWILHIWPHLLETSYSTINLSKPPNFLTGHGTTMTKNSCRPALPNTTYLTIGQDFFSIQEYVQEQYNWTLHHHQRRHVSSTDGNNEQHSLSQFAPAAAMFYTDIQHCEGLQAQLTMVVVSNTLLASSMLFRPLVFRLDCG